MLTAIVLCFAFALVFTLFGKHLRGRITYLISLLPLGLFIYFLGLQNSLAAGGEILSTYPWISSLGIDLSFRLDGLSQIFTLIITGIGFTVFLYAAEYLRGHPFLDRFYGYLLMFMGSMLGLVLSDNLITLFIFWELTSISSFFLIGFNHRDQKARKAALTALVITGGGGLFMLLGFVLMGMVSGTYSISEIVLMKSLFSNSIYLGLIVLALFAGAFTKSAQFPFHFWLPDAMRAPTPISTYLHSATMVKAGVYLLARFSPLFDGEIYWNEALILFGTITFIYGAAQSIFKTDLKAILAYTTIAALGTMVMLIGIGTSTAIYALLVFICVHALYKAGLFLVVGSIDKICGTRDITKIRGLRKNSVVLFVAALLAAISSAGLIPTIGYHGKHLIYGSVIESGAWGIGLLVLTIAASILLLCAGFLVGLKPFIGSVSPKVPRHKHTPPAMWITPLLLGLTGLGMGIFYRAPQELLFLPALESLHGDIVSKQMHLWSGVDTLFWLSWGTILGGVLLYVFFRPSHEYSKRDKKFEKFHSRYLLEQGVINVKRIFSFLTHVLQNGYLRYYTAVILTFLIVLISLRMYTGFENGYEFEFALDFTFNELATIIVMVVSILLAVFTTSRVVAVASLGGVGLCICLLFVYFSAPDLAMTQFTIDTLTVVLFVLLLKKLPLYLSKVDTGVNWRDLIISCTFGLLVTIITLEILFTGSVKEISNFYAENAYLLAKGKNVVNVILVDFRGVDTLIEITVLAVSGLGVFSLIRLKMGIDRER